MMSHEWLDIDVKITRPQHFPGPDMAAAPPGDSRETLLAELEDARLLVATLQVANVELAEGAM